MQGVRKRFDRELWLVNDALARDGVRSLFKKFPKLELREHPNSKKVDLQVFKNGVHVANIETEIKKVWKTKEFPYESIQFPERKKKFCKFEGVSTIFLMWNSDSSAYLSVVDDDLLASPLKEVPNKYVYKGEFFFQVPIENAAFDLKTSLKKIGVI